MGKLSYKLDFLCGDLELYSSILDVEGDAPGESLMSCSRRRLPGKEPEKTRLHGDKPGCRKMLSNPLLLQVPANQILQI